MIYILKIYTLLLVIVVVGCSSPLTESLQMAGENKKELLTVLDHFKAIQDSDKLHSAQFIIENMPYHFTPIWDFQKNSFIPNEYTNKKVVKEVMDSLGIRYSIDGINPDITNVKADYFIDRIESAYAIYAVSPWAGQFTQEDFNEYILPYRVAQEQLENWWDPLNKQLLYAIDLTENDNIDSATSIVDKVLSSEFKYDPRYTYYKPDMTYSDFMIHNGGMCNHCANLMVLGLRSIGIPSTVDFVPFWGNTSYGHSWNVVKLENEKWKPFELGQYTKDFVLAYLPGKVLRKTFSINQKYVSDLKTSISIPPFLLAPRFSDVTRKYRPVANVRLKKSLLNNESNTPVLSVWNNERWKAIWYGLTKGDSLIFEGMGVDVVYLPQVYSNGEYITNEFPIWLTENGGQIVCQPDYSRPITIKNIYSWKYNISMEKQNTTNIGSYELLVWDRGWQVAGISTPEEVGVFDGKRKTFVSVNEATHPENERTGYILNYRNVPSGGLYRLNEKGQRPFVVKDKQVIFL